MTNSPSYFSPQVSQKKYIKIFQFANIPSDFEDAAILKDTPSQSLH